MERDTWSGKVSQNRGLKRRVNRGGGHRMSAAVVVGKLKGLVWKGKGKQAGEEGGKALERLETSQQGAYV